MLVALPRVHRKYEVLRFSSPGSKPGSYCPLACPLGRVVHCPSPPASPPNRQSAARRAVGEAATARRDRCPRRLAARPRRPRRARPASHAPRADRRRANQNPGRAILTPSAKRRPWRVTIARVSKQITLRVRCACDGRRKPIPRNVGQGYQRHVVAKHLSTRSRRSCPRRALRRARPPLRGPCPAAPATGGSPSATPTERPESASWRRDRSRRCSCTPSDTRTNT